MILICAKTNFAVIWIKYNQLLWLDLVHLSQWFLRHSVLCHAEGFPEVKIFSGFAFLVDFFVKGGRGIILIDE